ncbi:MAG: LysR family transcriptional regulator [Pseudomonadota bacterium]
MTTTTHLRALQALELALRRGSLKLAAAELAITPAAVGQRIKSLEDYLGFDLLVRGRSGIRSAPELQRATGHLHAAFRELDTVCRLLDFQRLNEIHITADSDWASLWLEPRLDAFRALSPNTQFCVNGIGDVPARLGDADCEVVLANAASPDMGNALFTDYLVPVVSPVNRQRIADLPSATRLDGFPLLHLDSYTIEAGDVGWSEWIAKFGHRKEPPAHGIRYKRITHALEAVCADSGFIICGLGLVQQQLDSGELTLPFPLAEGIWSRNTYRAQFTERALARGPVRQFRDWLLTESQLIDSEIAERVALSQRSDKRPARGN